ncbi:MAG: TolC family protein [Nitrospinota bacterium]|nr:TolC family protein [Nitrospinota bacterium]
MRSIFLSGLFLIVGVSGAWGQTISMESFLERVKVTHPYFRKETLAVEVERKTQESLVGTEDWVLSGSPSYLHAEPARAGGFTPESIDQMGVTVGLSRHYWSTGSTLSFEFGHTYSDQRAEDIQLPLPDGPVSLPNDAGVFRETGLSVTYRHPLMQNSGGLLSRLAHDLQGFNVEAATIVAEENQENFLLNIGGKYIDWALLAEQRAIADARLELAKNESARTQEKRKHNLVDDVDVIRAKDAVIIGRQNIGLIDSAMAGIEAELRTIASMEAGSKLAPDFDLYSPARDILPLAQSLERLGESSRLLRIFDIRLRQVESQKMGASEAEKPRLDAVLQGGVKGGGAELGDSTQMDKPQALAALVFSYPLGATSARADIAKAALQQERISEERSSTLYDLQGALKNTLARITILEQALALDRERIKIAEEKTKAELKRYDQGRSELTFVIQSRDSEEAARLVHARDCADYHRLALVYRALMDTLLPSPAVEDAP